jgi:hypothetical protein
MKSYSICVLILSLITSCNLKQSRDFEFIDLSIYKDRPQKYYCIKIFQDGQAFIKSYNGNRYILSLNKSTLDTIFSLTNSIIDSKFDSVYYTDCLACINFNLIIKTSKSKFQVFHIGDLYSNDKFKKLDDYVCYLNQLIDRSMISVDSSFKFESWTDHLLPPPPPPMTKDIKKD